jgi:L-fuconolactonase
VVEPSVPILDTHQHLWDLSRFRLPWLDGGGPLARSHVLDDYRAAAEGLNVVGTVYMEVDVEPAQKRAEAEYVVELCARDDTPLAGAVIGGFPADERFEGYLDAAARSPFVKGVRQVLHGGTPAGYCLGDDFVRGIRLLGARGLTFDLCLRPGELADGARLAERCPDTRFILDHCGNAPVRGEDLSDWKRGIDAVAARPNTVCKISGIVAGARPGEWRPDDLAPAILQCVEAFGHDRVMFGSDWPVCTLAATYRQWVEALRTIVASWNEEDRRKLFHDNAARFYGLAAAA